MTAAPSRTALGVQLSLLAFGLACSSGTTEAPSIARPQRIGDPLTPVGCWVPVDEQGREPVLALQSESYGFFELGARLRLAIWPDGRTIWSSTPEIGGEPYFEGRVSPQDLADAARQLRSAFDALEGPKDEAFPEHARVLILKLFVDEGVLSSAIIKESSWAEEHRDPSLAGLWREIERVAADLAPEQREPCAPNAFRMRSVFGPAAAPRQAAED